LAPPTGQHHLPWNIFGCRLFMEMSAGIRQPHPQGGISMRKFLSAAALAALLAAASSPALAGSCPKLMKEVDAALASGPQLTAAQMTQVTKLRSEGEAQHKAGSHKDSVESLKKAKEILGIM
jgi:membrane protein required for beta-lactamase induction